MSDVLTRVFIDVEVTRQNSFDDQLRPYIDGPCCWQTDIHDRNKLHRQWHEGALTGVARLTWEWHQDGLPQAYFKVQTKPSDHRMWLALWSSHHPTEIRDIETQEVMVTEPGHLYLFDNEAFEHRAPQEYNPAPDAAPREFWRGMYSKESCKIK